MDMSGGPSADTPRPPGFEYTMIYQDSWPEYQEYHAISEYQAEYQQNTTNGNTKHYQKKRAPGVIIILRSASNKNLYFYKTNHSLPSCGTVPPPRLAPTAAAKVFDNG